MPPATRYLISAPTCFHTSIFSSLSSVVCCLWRGPTPSGESPKRRGSRPRASPWGLDDCRRHFRFLGTGAAAVFRLLLPFSHCSFLSRSSLVRGEWPCRLPEVTLRC